MEKLNLYSLKMKLDRHKISYSLSDDNKSIQIGKAGIGLTQWITTVILPFSAALIIILLIAAGIIPVIKRLTSILFAVPIGYGIFSLFMISKKRKSNKNIKFISQGLVKIRIDEVEESFETDRIKSIDYNIDHHNEGVKEGALYLVDSEGRKHKLLGILDEEKKYLENDLNYIRDYFKMLIGLK